MDKAIDRILKRREEYEVEYLIKWKGTCDQSWASIEDLDEMGVDYQNHINTFENQPKGKRGKGKGPTNAPEQATKAPPTTKATKKPKKEKAARVLHNNRSATLFNLNHLQQELIANTEAIDKWKATWVEGAMDLAFEVHALASGWMSTAFRIDCADQAYMGDAIPASRQIFVKINQNDYAKPMFEAEAFAAEHVRALDIFRVPRVIGIGDLTTTEGSYFMMECVVMKKAVTNKHRKAWADGLIQLHAKTNPNFGFSCDNYLGRFFQHNKTSELSWVDFFKKHRLAPAIQIAKEKKPAKVNPRYNRLLDAAQDLLETCDMFFEGVDIVPSLVHGDLEANFMVDEDDKPCFFDSCPFFGITPFFLPANSSTLETPSYRTASLLGQDTLCHLPVLCHNEYDFGPFDLVSHAHLFENYFISFPKQAGWEARNALYTFFHHFALVPNAQTNWCLNKCETVLKQLKESSKIPIRSGFTVGTFTVEKIAVPSEELKNAVLVCQGSFAPVHFNHLTIMESAKLSLEKNHGYKILGGYISPTHDRFMKKKLNGKDFPLESRARLIYTATKNSDWLMPESVGLGTQILLSTVEQNIRNHTGKPIEIIKVCGADTGPEVLKRVPKNFKLAIVRRPNCDEQLQQFIKAAADQKRIIPILEWEGPDISSTKVRQLFLANDMEGLAAMMPLNVINQMVQENMVSYFAAKK